MRKYYVFIPKLFKAAPNQLRSFTDHLDAMLIVLLSYRSNVLGSELTLARLSSETDLYRFSDTGPHIILYLLTRFSIVLAL